METTDEAMTTITTPITQSRPTTNRSSVETPIRRPATRTEFGSLAAATFSLACPCRTAVRPDDGPRSRTSVGRLADFIARSQKHRRTERRRLTHRPPKGTRHAHKAPAHVARASVLG